MNIFLNQLLKIHNCKHMSYYFNSNSIQSDIMYICLIHLMSCNFIQGLRMLHLWLLCPHHIEYKLMKNRISSIPIDMDCMFHYYLLSKILENIPYIYQPSINNLHIQKYNFDKPWSHFDLHKNDTHMNRENNFHFRHIACIHHCISNNTQKS